MLSVIMLNVVMLSIITLSIVMLNILMLSVIVLNVVMLSVVAPKPMLYFAVKCEEYWYKLNKLRQTYLICQFCRKAVVETLDDLTGECCYGACIIKLITTVIYGFRNKLVFVASKPFQPSLVFRDKCSCLLWEP